MSYGNYPNHPPVPYGPPPPLVPIQPRNGLAIAGLVLGITSVVFCWWGIFTLAQVVLAITFGAVGINRANRGAPNKGMAIAGLILGCVGAVAYLIIGIASLGVGFLV